MVKNFGTKITVEAEPFYLPLKANDGDAAYDLFTHGITKVTPGKRAFVPLGFKIALPTNMALIIHPRSGQSGKGMIASVDFPKWLGGGTYIVRIDADEIIGIVDSEYGDTVHAIVKFGKLRLRHRILRMLGGKFYIPSHSRICQGRFVYVPTVSLVFGKVTGKRSGLGSTDK